MILKRIAFAHDSCARGLAPEHGSKRPVIDACIDTTTTLSDDQDFSRGRTFPHSRSFTASPSAGGGP